MTEHTTTSDFSPLPLFRSGDPPASAEAAGADLAALAERINQEHAAAESAAKSAIEHALECGRLLIQAKAQVNHGEFLPWLKTNCTIGERQARNYMRVTRNWGSIEMKTAPGADLTIKSALRLLSYDDDGDDDEPVDEPVDDSDDGPNDDANDVVIHTGDLLDADGGDDHDDDDDRLDDDDRDHDADDPECETDRTPLSKADVKRMEQAIRREIKALRTAVIQRGGPLSDPLTVQLGLRGLTKASAVLGHACKALLGLELRRL